MNIFGFLVTVWQVNGVPICTAPKIQYFGAIAGNEKGGAVIVWEDWNRGKQQESRDIYAQRIDADGNVLWQENGIVVSNADSAQWSPNVVKSGEDYIISWSDSRNFDSCHFDIYAQKLSSSGNKVWDSLGIVVCNAPGQQWDHRLVPDGMGGAILTWVDWRPNNSNIDYYAQRTDAQGNARWQKNGMNFCNAYESSLQGGQICAVSDGNYGIIIAWKDGRNQGTTGHDIYIQRLDSSGYYLWKYNGVRLTNASNHEMYPDIACDDNGNAFVVWYDYRYGWNSNSASIYVQKVDRPGNALWDTNGVCVVCTTAYQDPFLQQRIISDDKGGCITTWSDRRDSVTTASNIYVQRINSSGTSAWTVCVCDAPGEQRRPMLVSDKLGGAILIWWDKRNGNWDIYCQRIDSTGQEVFEHNGLPLCDAPDSQTYPQIVNTGEGKAIAVWNDYRNREETNGDIYAMLIPPSGAIEEKSMSKNQNVKLEVYPNPFTQKTVIEFTVGTRHSVSLQIYDLSGRLVKSFLINQNPQLKLGANQPINSITWDARNEPAGIYFLKLKAGDSETIQKLILVK